MEKEIKTMQVSIIKQNVEHKGAVIEGYGFKINNINDVISNAEKISSSPDIKEAKTFDKVFARFDEKIAPISLLLAVFQYYTQKELTSALETVKLEQPCEFIYIAKYNDLNLDYFYCSSKSLAKRIFNVLSSGQPYITLK